MKKRTLIQLTLSSACTVASLVACISSIKQNDSIIVPICWGICTTLWLYNTISTINKLSK